MSNSLYRDIREFYDASSELWESIWGEHMHHGYYGKNGNYRLDRRQAQIDLIEELLLWADCTGKSPDGTPQNIVDVGCGIGGSTLHLAQKFGCKATGITLSPVQASRAKERAEEANLSDAVSFEVANALEMPFADDTFDLVWSLESGEHMPDKAKFLSECYRVLKPGGKVDFCYLVPSRNQFLGGGTDNEGSSAPQGNLSRLLLTLRDISFRVSRDRSPVRFSAAQVR